MMVLGHGRRNSQEPIGKINVGYAQHHYLLGANKKAVAKHHDIDKAGRFAIAEIVKYPGANIRGNDSAGLTLAPLHVDALERVVRDTVPLPQIAEESAHETEVVVVGLVGYTVTALDRGHETPGIIVSEKGATGVKQP